MCVLRRLDYNRERQLCRSQRATAPTELYSDRWGLRAGQSDVEAVTVFGSKETEDPQNRIYIDSGFV